MATPHGKSYERRSGSREGELREDGSLTGLARLRQPMVAVDEPWGAPAVHANLDGRQHGAILARHADVAEARQNDSRGRQASQFRSGTRTATVQ